MTKATMVFVRLSCEHEVFGASLDNGSSALEAAWCKRQVTFTETSAARKDEFTFLVLEEKLCFRDAL